MTEQSTAENLAHDSLQRDFSVENMYLLHASVNPACIVVPLRLDNKNGIIRVLAANQWKVLLMLPRQNVCTNYREITFFKICFTKQL